MRATILEAITYRTKTYVINKIQLRFGAINSIKDHKTSTIKIKPTLKVEILVQQANKFVPIHVKPGYRLFKEVGISIRSFCNPTIKVSLWGIHKSISHHVIWCVHIGSFWISTGPPQKVILMWPISPLLQLVSLQHLLLQLIVHPFRV